jgi:solute carrier family 25 protein 33/36
MTIFASLFHRFIIETEGVRALFKGLGPTLVGVAPYRAIYFYTYASSKQVLSKYLPAESTLLHIASAFSAGFLAVTGTNPIWFVKTRMQLDESRSGVGAREVINKLYKEKGIAGFYKGISASYFGIIETAIYFTIYEKLKKFSNEEFSPSFKFLGYFGSAGFSKSLASCLCYPHGKHIFNSVTFSFGSFLGNFSKKLKVKE